MAGSKKNDFSINTIIGPDTEVHGSLKTGGFTRVDGNVRGDISAQGRVVIGEAARMKGNLTGTFVTVGGVVMGNVIAGERIIILATGLVMGDIITRRIEADEGCLLHGRVRICTNDEMWNKTVAEYRDRLAIERSHGQG